MHIHTNIHKLAYRHINLYNINILILKSIYKHTYILVCVLFV